METRLSKACIAEFIGTFALIFVGAGAGALGLGGLLGVAFAHAGVVVGFAYAFGHISGTHINPAVTAAIWAVGGIQAPRALAYWAAQLAGGLCGLALRGALGGTETGLGATVLAQGLEVGEAVIHVSPVAGLALEILLTFFLVNSVLHCAVGGKAGSHAGMAIGMTLVACILVGGPLTGAALNPARTLGPAVAASNYGDLWLYFAGPILGGLLAAFLYKKVLTEG